MNYGYGNSNWKDQLTSYNGTAISYDASGNPLNWRTGYTLSWTGRQLDQLNIGNVQYTYKYNADGLRVSKSNGTDTYTYRWDGTTLLSQDHKGTTVVFLYSDVELVGFNCNGNNYYYGIDNLGVIRYVYNESGAIVATYYYDAWGKVLSVSGDMSVIAANPIRYKSYYYDNETGFYYLQSRYYDPTVGRFINADDVEYLLENETGLFHNLYTYCENSPIIGMDSQGNVISTISWILHYNYNKKFKFSGYINGQALGNQAKLKMGLLRGKDNGCGWIATYNACIMLGEKVHPAKIIRYFESTNGILLFGALGVNYGSIRVFFWERGYKVKMTFDSYNFDEVAQNNKANIILFQTSSKTWHYVAFTWNGSEYLMYNIESKYKSVFRSPYILSLYRNGGKPIVLISIS